MTATKRIFVQIASYRDRECQWTVSDLFLKATAPERISVGICCQFDPARDMDCFAEPAPYPDQVRLFICMPEHSGGMNWARVQAQSLWQGEDYVLQIDSHMRFEPGWDEQLIAMLERCPSARPVLSSIPAGYTPGQSHAEYSTSLRTRVKVNCVIADWILPPLQLHGELQPDAGIHQGLLRSAFALGCFVFARSDTFERVPIDPHIQFHADELDLSVRLWTHGYDIFQPNSTVIYHWWKSADNNAGLAYKQIADQRRRHSFSRLRHLLLLKSSDDPQALHDIDRYSLGAERTLQSFWLFAGLDMVAGVVREHALRGDFEEPYHGAMRTMGWPKAAPMVR